MLLTPLERFDVSCTSGEQQGLWHGEITNPQNTQEEHMKKSWPHDNDILVIKQSKLAPQVGYRGQTAHLQGKAGSLNLLLASHEDKNIAGRMAQVHSQCLLDCCLHVVLLGRLRE